MSFETKIYVMNNFAAKWHKDLYDASIPEQALALSVAEDCIKLGASIVNLEKLNEVYPDAMNDYMAFENNSSNFNDFKVLLNIIFTKAIRCLYKDTIRSLSNLFWFDKAFKRLGELTDMDVISESLNSDADIDLTTNTDDEESDEENDADQSGRIEEQADSENEEHHGGFNNKLPYGLCKKAGIKVPEGTVYSEAWKLFTGKTGITEEEAIRQARETGEVNVSSDMMPAGPAGEPAEQAGETAEMPAVTHAGISASSAEEPTEPTEASAEPAATDASILRKRGTSFENICNRMEFLNIPEIEITNGATVPTKEYIGRLHDCIKDVDAWLGGDADYKDGGLIKKLQSIKNVADFKYFTDSMSYMYQSLLGDIDLLKNYTKTHKEAQEVLDTASKCRAKLLSCNHIFEILRDYDASLNTILARNILDLDGSYQKGHAILEEMDKQMSDNMHGPDYYRDAPEELKKLFEDFKNEISSDSYSRFSDDYDKRESNPLIAMVDDKLGDYLDVSNCLKYADYYDVSNRCEAFLKSHSPELYSKYADAKKKYDSFRLDFYNCMGNIVSYSRQIKDMSLEDLKKTLKNFYKTFADTLNFIARKEQDISKIQSNTNEAIEMFYAKREYDRCEVLNKKLNQLREDIHKAIEAGGGTSDAGPKVPEEGEFESFYGKVRIDKGEHYLVHDDSEFTQQKKDAAKWFKSIKETLDYISKYLPEVYKNMSPEEKMAIWEYTYGSSEYNGILQGYQGYWDNYVSLDNIRMTEDDIRKINLLTKAIGRSKLRDGMWMQHGVYEPKSVWQMFGYDITGNYLPDINTEAGRNELAERFQQAIDSGEELYSPCFMSYGGAKGTGFDDADIVMNSYFPAGTEALYASPVSQFGGIGHGIDKDLIRGYQGQDVTKPDNYHASCQENEFIIQRGSVYKLKKFEFKKGSDGKWKMFLDMDCVAQKPAVLPDAAA